MFKWRTEHFLQKYRGVGLTELQQLQQPFWSCPAAAAALWAQRGHGDTLRFWCCGAGWCIGSLVPARRMECKQGWRSREGWGADSSEGDHWSKPPYLDTIERAGRQYLPVPSWLLLCCCPLAGTFSTLILSLFPYSTISQPHLPLLVQHLPSKRRPPALPLSRTATGLPAHRTASLPAFLPAAETRASRSSTP